MRPRREGIVGRRLVLGILALALLAGCVEPTSPTASPSATPTVKPPSNPTGTGEQDPRVAPLLFFEGCRGLYARGEIPAEQAQKHIPKAFIPLGLSSRTASFALMAIDCKTASGNNHVMEDSSIFWTGLWVRPINQSWRQDAPEMHFFTLDQFVNEDRLVSAFANFSIPAQKSELRLEEATTGDAQTRKVSAKTETASMTIDGTYAQSGTLTQRTTYWIWSGKDTHYRTAFQWEHKKPTPENSLGTLTLTGTSASSQALGEKQPALGVPADEGWFRFAGRTQFG